jgi:hypothetical protein
MFVQRTVALFVPEPNPKYPKAQTGEREEWSFVRIATALFTG